MTMGQIKITGDVITKEEQLAIARLLIKAGYTVNIKEAGVVGGKGISFINYETED